MPTERHGVDEVESDDHEISAAMALRLLKRKGLKPFLVLIMPKESPDSEAAALDTLPSAAPKYRLPPEYQTELSELLDQFPDVFSESPKAGGANVEPLRNIIDLVPGSKPPFRKNYRLSPREYYSCSNAWTALCAQAHHDRGDSINPLGSRYR